jgi:hypothetical protein
MSMMDERALTRRNRIIGFLGPRSSSFTLAWLATHRDRLRSMVLGGKRLTVLVIYDRRGAELVPHDDVELEAIRRLVYGPEPTP